MANGAHMTMDAQRLMGNVSVHVRITGLRRWHARWWLTVQCLRLARWLSRADSWSVSVIARPPSLGRR